MNHFILAWLDILLTLETKFIVGTVALKIRNKRIVNSLDSTIFCWMGSRDVSPLKSGSQLNRNFSMVFICPLSDQRSRKWSAELPIICEAQFCLLRDYKEVNEDIKETWKSCFWSSFFYRTGHKIYSPCPIKQQASGGTPLLPPLSDCNLLKVETQNLN